MKPTLMTLMVVAIAAPALATAQKPVPREVPWPKVEPFVHVEPNFDTFVFPKFEIEHQMEMLKFDASDLRHLTEQFAQLDVAQMKFEAQDLAWHAQELANIELGHMDLADVKVHAMEHKNLALLDMPKLADKFGPRSDKFLDSRPPAPWAQEDPADSLYRTAREALNRGEYRRAAQLFNEVTKKFPKSKYAQDCAYWEAFARYRVGSDDDLRLALKLLEGIDVEAMMRVGRETAVDIPALRARIQGALAARGDREAAAKLQSEAKQNDGCDREEVSVRAEALAALGQMDLASAMPVVKKVLARRDECTVELRRRALYLLGRQGNSEALPIMLDVAKNDTDSNIRGEAMSWMSRLGGDQAVPLLEELLRTANDERTQRSAVNALASIDTDRARRAVRAIIERNDAVERVRYEAIMSLSRDREGTFNKDDMAYLRGLYTKLESPRLREAVLTSVSRIGMPENEQFLLAIARNQNETPSLRATALQRLGRMSSVGLDDIAKLYDVADSRSLREQILYALYQRKESEAVDKMIEIAKRDTDPQIRRTAISLLARRDDPRARKWLQEIIDR